MSLKKIGGKIFDDILGIDPSGKGLVGSIKDNPKTAALLGSLFIPGVGSAITGGLGAAGSAIGSGLGTIGSALGSGLGALGGLGSSALGAVGGLSGLGGLLGSVAPFVTGYGVGQQQGPQIPPQGFYNMPSMGGGLLGVGAPIGQSAFDYARSIAGGMPFEQVVQPGMEFSLEQPMGGPVTRQPQAQVPSAPVTQLFPGIDASIGGYRDPSEMLGGGAFDPFDRFRAPEIDPFRDGIRPSEIRGPGGDIFGGPLGPGGRLEDIIGDKQDDGVFVGGSRDFREYDPLKDPFAGARAPEIDPFRDGIRPTEIFGPGGQIVGPMGRMSDVQPRSDQDIIDLIEGRLGEYQPVIPQQDLSGFARLEDIPSFVPRTDEEIRGLIGEGIAGIPTPAQFDPSGLQRRLAALEGREIPQFDPSGILSRLSALEAQGEPRYTQPGTEKDILPPKSPLGKLSLFG